jgi:hypothetical protein
MHFVDHDHAVVTGEPARIRRTFQIEDAGVQSSCPECGVTA